MLAVAVLTLPSAVRQVWQLAVGSWQLLSVTVRVLALLQGLLGKTEGKRQSGRVGE
jgi:hypothetical protein